MISGGERSPALFLSSFMHGVYASREGGVADIDQIVLRAL